MVEKPGSESDGAGGAARGQVAPEPALPAGELAAPAVDWPAIRAEYGNRKIRVADICLRHGITRSALQWRAKVELWPKRYRTNVVDRPQIIARLFRVLEKQTMKLEMTMRDGDQRPAGDKSDGGEKANGAEKPERGEKEVVVLGRLASTLEKLIEIDNRASAEKRRPGPTRDMKDLRNRLARRIAQLEGD